MEGLKDVAYYYPAPYWRAQESDGIKSLLLFFDEVAILLPDYMYGKHISADPALTAPLEERGLLRILEPKEWVDSQMTRQLADVIFDLLAQGVFDDLPKAQYFAELSRSRMGYGADVELADFLVEELQKQGLAKLSDDGVSIPLHPAVRTMFLVILGQLARTAALERLGVVLHPATNLPEAAIDMVETLSLPTMPSCHSIIKLDLEPASLDLSSIPLDDVLQLREDHGSMHQEYMRSLRGFLVELGQIKDPKERELALLKRQQDTADLANDARRMTRNSVGKNLASWGLGITGAVWSIGTGDPLGAALGAAGLAVGRVPVPAVTAGAYSYLFNVTSAFGRSSAW